MPAGRGAALRQMEEWQHGPRLIRNTIVDPGSGLVIGHADFSDQPGADRMQLPNCRVDRID
jgi:hypothetical protein